MEGELQAVSVYSAQHATATTITAAAIDSTIDEFRDCASRMASFAAGVELRCKELRLAEEKVEGAMKELERKKVELEKGVEAAKRKSVEVNAREEEFEILVKKEIAQRRKCEEELAAVEAKLKELGEREEDFESLGSYIEERGIRVRELEEEVERKRKELEGEEKEIGLQREGIERGSAELKERQCEFEVRLSELNGRERGLDEKERQCRELESNSHSCLDELIVRERGFEVRVDEFSKRELKIDLRLGELSKKEREIDEREKGFRGRFVELEARQVKFEECLRESKVKEREMEEKEARFQKKLEDFRAKEVQFKEDVSRLGLKERGIEEKEKQSKELQLKLQQEFMLREREFEQRVVEFSKRQLKIDSRLGELSKKESGIDRREKGLRERFVEFEARQAKFEESLCESKAKEREMEEKEGRFQKKLEEFRAKEVKEDVSRLGLKERGIEEKVNQSMELQFKLQQWSDDLEVREKRLLEQEKVISEKDKVLRRTELEVQQRSGDIKTKEKQLEQKLEVFKAKKVRFERCCNKRLAEFEADGSKYSNLKLMEKNVEDQSKMPGERIKEVEFKEKQLEESRQKQFEITRRESELKDQNFFKPFSSQVKVEPLDSSSYRPLDDSSEANITFCMKMNGIDLQMFLNERSKDHDSLKDEVEAALRLASDPAKLVLDAMQGFYSPREKKGNVVFEEAVIRKSCVLLLERLTKLAPEIKPTVRKQAMILAFAWRKRMTTDAKNSLEVLAFLQLLAAYRLASYFEDDDELVAQLGVLSDYSQAPMLLRDLGFTDKIYSLIQKLIEKECHAKASRLIVAFKLHDEFPSMSSLEDDHQEPNAVPLIGNKFTAPGDSVLMSCSDTASITPDSPTLSGQCSGAKRRWTDACVDSNHDSPNPANLPGQQPEKLPSYQGCTGSLPLNSEDSIEPLKSLFVPQCIDENCRCVGQIRAKIAHKMLCCPEVSAALQLASDPAEFVLGVVKNPSSLTLMMGDEAVSLAFPEHGPLLLLDQLWRMSPYVKPDVEREALSFAMDWISKLSNQLWKDNLDTACFMLFVAAYKLDSSLDCEVIFNLVRSPYWSSEAMLLFRTLNLKDFVTKFLKYLIRNNQRREALRCILVSGLLNKFASIRNLLNKYLQQCSKGYPKTIFEELEVISRELFIWKTIAEHVLDQNLASSFGAHIGFLCKLKKEKEKVEARKKKKAARRRRWAAKNSDHPSQQKQDTAGCLSVASLTATPPPSPSPIVVIPSINNTTTTSTSYSSTAPQLQEESANKRLKVVGSSNEPQNALCSDRISDPPQQPLQLTEASAVNVVPCPTSPETTTEADKNFQPTEQQIPCTTAPQSVPESDQNLQQQQQQQPPSPLQFEGGSFRPGGSPSAPQSTPGVDRNFHPPPQQQQQPLQFPGGSFGPGAGPCPSRPQATPGSYWNFHPPQQQQQQQQPLQFTSGLFRPVTQSALGSDRICDPPQQPLQLTEASAVNVVPCPASPQTTTEADKNFQPTEQQIPCTTAPQSVPESDQNLQQQQQQQPPSPLQFEGGSFRPGGSPSAPQSTPGVDRNFHPPPQQQQQPLQFPGGSFGPGAGPCPSRPQATPGSYWNFHPPQQQQQQQQPLQFTSGLFRPVTQSALGSDRICDPPQQPLQLTEASAVNVVPCPTSPETTTEADKNFQPTEQQIPCTTAPQSVPESDQNLQQQQQQQPPSPLQFEGGSFRPGGSPSAPQSTPGVDRNLHPRPQQQQPLQFPGGSFGPGAGPYPVPPRGTPGSYRNFYPPQLQQQQRLSQFTQSLFRPVTSPCQAAPQSTPGVHWNFRTPQRQPSHPPAAGPRPVAPQMTPWHGRNFRPPQPSHSTGSSFVGHNVVRPTTPYGVSGCPPSGAYPGHGRPAHP